MLEYLKEATRAMLQSPFVRAKCRTNRWRKHFYERYSLARNAQSRCLDIGSGPTPRNPLRAKSIVGVDIRSSATVVECDLCGGRLPFSDGSFEAITAFDFLEHIPRVLSKLGDAGALGFLSSN